MNAANAIDFCGTVVQTLSGSTIIRDAATRAARTIDATNSQCQTPRP